MTGSLALRRRNARWWATYGLRTSGTGDDRQWRVCWLLSRCGSVLYLVLYLVLISLLWSSLTWHNEGLVG